MQSDDLWNLLHQSDEEGFLVFGLRYHLDDSGSDDGSPLVTCGGAAMSKANFEEFSRRWARMYERKRSARSQFEPPLHMSDFVRNGKYAGAYPEFKRNLLLDVAKLINEHKFFSISVAVSQRDFDEVLSTEVKRNLIGPYAIAFFCIVLGHQTISAKHSRGPLRASYLVDAGFGQQNQLNEAHRFLVRFEQATGGFKHTGALATDTDDRVPALQAADAISWASRQMELHHSLPEGFEPLLDVINEDISPPHVTISIPRDGIEMFADPINAWLTKHGAMPKLTEIAGREINGQLVKLKDN